jgi:hypothetical protein
VQLRQRPRTETERYLDNAPTCRSITLITLDRLDRRQRRCRDRIGYDRNKIRSKSVSENLQLSQYIPTYIHPDSRSLLLLPTPPYPSFRTLRNTAFHILMTAAWRPSVDRLRGKLETSENRLHTHNNTQTPFSNHSAPPLGIYFKGIPFLPHFPP